MQITETTRSLEVPFEPIDTTLEVRELVAVVTADHEDDAREGGYEAWDEKYGYGNRPRGAIVRISPIV